MLTIYSDDHHLHHGRCELMDGQLMPCFEMPSRADHVLQRVKARELGPVLAPQDFGLAPLQRVHSRDYLDFFKGAWATLDRIRRGRRPVALHLARPHLAPRAAHQPARPARLLQLRRRRTDYRRHLASGLQRRPGRVDRTASDPARRPLCLRAVPPAGAPRRQRLDGRLLLPQQRRHRRPGVSRPGPSQGGDPRRGLPPRQWHSIDLLRSATTCSSPRSMGIRRRSSRFSWATPMSREKAPGKASTSTTRCRPVPGGRAGARRWTRPAGRSSATTPTSSSCRWVWTRSRTTRSRSSSSTARITWPWAHASRAWASPRCS